MAKKLPNPTVTKLPPVLRTKDEGLLTEDDPAQLEAYADELWHQWQTIERDNQEAAPDGKGAPAPTGRKREPKGKKTGPRTTKTYVKAAFAWLLDCFVETGTPLPYSMARLGRAIVGPSEELSTLSPVRHRTEQRYWAAIKIEAAAGRQIPTIYEVAKKLLEEGRRRREERQRPNERDHSCEAWYHGPNAQKTAEKDIRDWRKLPHYQENVQLYREEKLER